MDDAGHQPVMLAEVLGQLQPAARQVIVDATVGLGGHAEALLLAAGPETTLIGIDLDPENLLITKERLARFRPRVRLFEANFADLADVLAEAGLSSADAILADVGVCSAQLNDPRRGFSFQADGPLDMRLGQQGRTAADLVNTLGEHELADLIWRYGEDRFSRRIARALVAARRTRRIERTAELADIVRSAVPGREYRRLDPATRTFQALRIAVNDELENLRIFLKKGLPCLSVGGRAAIICFHSLEDRLVKQHFAACARAGGHRLVTRRPLRPGEEEVSQNPRSRSGRLRVIERIR